MVKERLFIAANISDEQRANVARLVEDLQKGARFTKAHPKWARVAGMHLTVRFLGNVEETKKKQIIENLGPAVTSCRTFDLTLAKLGVFPDERSPRVLWLGVDKGKARLLKLAQAIQPALAPLGFLSEKRPYHPHLTLARIKSMRGVNALMDLVHSHRWPLAPADEGPPHAS